MRFRAISVLVLCAAVQGVSCQTSTLQATARLVVVDVIVTGRDSKPVHDLTCVDFQLEENHHPQTLQRCEEHRGKDAAAPATEAPANESNVFTNATAAPVPATFDVIVLDYLNVAPTDQPKLTDEVNKLLGAAIPGHQVALFVLGSQLTLVSGFTDNLALLARYALKTPGPFSGLGQAAGTESLGAAPEEMRGSPGGNMSKAVQIRALGGSFNPSEDPMFSLPTELKSSTVLGGVAAAGMQQHKRDLTLEAFDAADQYLMRLPGRKNIFWITSSIPQTLDQSTEGAPDFLGDFEASLANFARDRISLFPIEINGVSANAVVSAEVSSFGIANTPRQATDAMAAASNDETSRRGAMSRLASLTGGQAFYGSNDLDGLVHKALNTGSDYYTLSYSPEGPVGSKAFHAFEIKTPRRGLQLAYRNGYYLNGGGGANSAGPASAVAGVVPNKEASPEATRVGYAMRRGLPAYTALVFAVRVTPMGTSGVQPVLQKREPRKNEASAVIQRFAFDYRVDPVSLTWTRVGDTLSTDIRLFLVAYGKLGEVVDSRAIPVHLKFPAAQSEALNTGGVPVHQEVNLHGAGQLALRFGVEDENTGRLGTVEVASWSLHYPSRNNEGSR